MGDLKSVEVLRRAKMTTQVSYAELRISSFYCDGDLQELAAQVAQITGQIVVADRVERVDGAETSRVRLFSAVPVTPKIEE